MSVSANYALPLTNFMGRTQFAKRRRHAWYICSMAPLRVTSRYSLYALWKPVRDMYRTQMP